MTYAELQTILAKHPFLQILIKNMPLETLQIKFDDFKNFQVKGVTKIYFASDLIQSFTIDVAHISDLFKRHGRPRYIVHKEKGTITIYRYRSRKYTALPKLHVYTDPVTKKERIYENVKLLGTAKITKKNPEGVYLRGLCETKDGTKMCLFFVRFINFKNPQDHHLKAAQFNRGHWHFT